MSKFISLTGLSEFLAKCRALFYTKPSGGVPKTDLASGVQSSLNLADSAIQAEPVGSVTPAVTPYDYATREEVSQLGQEVNGLNDIVLGERVDEYTATGYSGNYVGSYDFKAGVTYNIKIQSQYSGTLYLTVCDAEHNVVQSLDAVPSFPAERTFTPAQDYDGACFSLSQNGTGIYTFIVTHIGTEERLDTVEDNQGVQTIVKSAVLSGDGALSATHNVEAGYVYKLVIESGLTGGQITLNAAKNNEYLISGWDAKTHYFAVFEDGAATKQIKLYRGAEGAVVSMTYSLYRMSGFAPLFANNASLLGFQRYYGENLKFEWVQGYYTTALSHNNNDSWCNITPQFNRGRRIKITYPTGYYVVLRRINLGTLAANDNGAIASDTILNTANFGPWIIGVRRTDYTSLKPEQAAAAVTITQLDGDIYEYPLGANGVWEIVNSLNLTSRVSALEAKDVELEAKDQINSRLGTLELGRFMHHLNVEASNPYIPSQSLFDIAYAKSLGFKMIEANLQTCSDGVVVVKHGIGGKLGAGLLFADGSGLSADTLFSAVSSTALRQNVTYNARQAKFRGHIPTIDEFCATCAKLGMIPFLRGCTTEMLATARKYLPDDCIIIEGPTARGDFRGMMTVYAGGATAAEILAACQAKGQPFYYDWSQAQSASDQLFAEVAQTLHANGYLLGAAYGSANTNTKRLSEGLDILVSTNDTIPSFEDGNALNIDSCGDSHIALTDATYDSTEETIAVQSGGTVAVSDNSFASSLMKMCLRIRYAGTLTIRIGSNNDNNRDLVALVSDGTSEIVFANAVNKSVNMVRITADADTTIYDFKLAASRI